MQEAKQQTGASKRGQRTKQQAGAAKREQARPQGRTPTRTRAGFPAPGTIVDDIRQLHRKVQAALVEMLLPGEQPHVVIMGALGCAIVATGERALVLKAGTRFGAPLAPRGKAFEYESVIGVRLDIEGDRAVVAIDAPVKIAYCRIYWADARDNAWKARNAIPVERPYGDVEAGVEELRGLLEAFRERHPTLGSHGVPIASHVPPKVQPLPVAEEDEGEEGAAEEEGAVISALPVIGERCPHCRAELRPGWRFCPGCGAPSESASARPTQPS